MVDCDCLNHCGDDPWLKDGRAKPCQYRLKKQAEAAKAREETHQLKLSAAAVGEWLNGGCNPKDIPNMHIASLVNFIKAATQTN
jgi:hypothetical protein